MRLMRSPAEGTQSETTPIQGTSEAGQLDSSARQETLRSPPPLFVPESPATVQPNAVEGSPVPTHPPVASTPVPTLLPVASDDLPPHDEEEVKRFIKDSWRHHLDRLATFDGMSWGSAYETIAQVKLLLPVGEYYGMQVNYAHHTISIGRFKGPNDTERTIGFCQLASYLTDLSIGTWKNKLWFFFAVYRFLHETKELDEPSIGSELYRIRQAMVCWGVYPVTGLVTLPQRDDRAKYRITPTGRQLRKYFGGAQG